jgi:DNA-binding CsgD family transcriptional regulator
MGPSEERLSRDPARAALGALADGGTSTVFIVGPPGSGKTFAFNRLESELGARHRADPAAVFLRPTNGTRDLTLGRLLVPAETTRQVLSTPTGSAPEPRLLAIDDIDLLDHSSMSLLAQSLDRGRFRLAATVRSRQAAEVFRTLRAVGRSAVVHVEPWQRDEVDGFVADVLGGRMHPLTIRRLLDFTGGNALCLTELVEVGSCDGHLRREHDVWSWRGDLFVPPLTEARVSGELEGVGEESRAVLATAALVGQVPLEVLEELHGVAAVEAADNTGLLRLEASAGHLMVRPRSVVQGRVLAQLVSTTRRRRLAVALLEALAEPALPAERVELPAARLAVAGSVAVPPGLAVGAAQEALRRHEPALAEEVLSAAAPSGGDHERADVLASALLAQGRLDPLNRARAPDVHAWTGSGLADVADQPLLARVSSLLQLGRPTAALEVAGGVDTCGFEPGQRVHLLALVGSCRLFRGELREAGDVAAQLRDLGLSEGWSYAYRLGALVAGRAGLLAAEVTDAERFLAESATCEPDAGSRALLPVTLAHLELARAMRGGRTPDRDGSPPTAPAEPGSAPRALHDLDALTRAELQLLTGLRHSALETAAAVADRSQQDGQVLVALQALHLAVRIRPSVGLARRVAETAARTDFDLSRTYAAHAEAAADRDGEGLTRVAEDYDRRGLRWLAAETGSAALGLALAHPTRRSPWAVDSRRLVDRLHARGQVSVPAWWWHGSEPFDALTDREREIAELAARGWSSRRLAEHLQLSQRTVENHLQHSYRKLGVTRRQQLSAALGHEPDGT